MASILSSRKICIVPVCIRSNHLLGVLVRNIVTTKTFINVLHHHNFSINLTLCKTFYDFSLGPGAPSSNMRGPPPPAPSGPPTGPPSGPPSGPPTGHPTGPPTGPPPPGAPPPWQAGIICVLSFENITLHVASARYYSLLLTRFHSKGTGS